MQIQIERIDPHSGRTKVIRLKTASARTPRFRPIVRAPVPAIRPASEPLNPPHVASLAKAVDDGSPAAGARKARRRLRRLHERAKHAAKGQVRPRRADEYRILQSAYRTVRWWQQDGVEEEIERELRANSEVPIGSTSGLFLVLFRSALPGLDPKRASKWAAALVLADNQDIRSKRLFGFLHATGGIEGAARERARLRAH